MTLRDIDSHENTFFDPKQMMFPRVLDLLKPHHVAANALSTIRAG